MDKQIKKITLGLVQFFCLCLFTYGLSAQCDDVGENAYPDLCVVQDGDGTSMGGPVAQDVYNAASGAPGTDGTDDIQVSIESTVCNSGCGSGSAYNIGGCVGSVGVPGGSSNGNSDFGAIFNLPTDGETTCINAGGYVIVTIDFINGFYTTAAGFDLPQSSNNGASEGYEGTFGWVTAGTDASGNPLTGLPNVNMGLFCSYTSSDYATTQMSDFVGANGAGSWQTDVQNTTPNNTGSMASDANGQNICGTTTANNGEDTFSGTGADDGVSAATANPNLGLNPTDIITQVKYVYFYSSTPSIDCDGDGFTAANSDPAGSWGNMTFCGPPAPAVECGTCTGEGGLFISELSFNPSTAQGADGTCEYIEIYNGYNTPIVTDANTTITVTGGATGSVPAGITIMPGEYVILAGANFASCNWSSMVPAGTQIIVAGTVGELGNGGESVTLNLTCGLDGDSNFTSTVDYTPFDGSGADGDGNAVYNTFDPTTPLQEGPPTPGTGDCGGCDNAYCCLAYDDVAMLCTGETVSMVGPGTAATMMPYSSDDDMIASVDNMGVVTGVAPGSAVITYTDSDGCTATATVTVVGCAVPGISIVKDDSTPDPADASDTDGVDTQHVQPGDDATFSITVCNTGTENLCNVSFTDANGPDCEFDEADIPAELADTDATGNGDGVWEPTECFTYECVVGNVTASFTNTIMVSAEGCTSGMTVMDEDPTEVTVPCIIENVAVTQNCTDTDQEYTICIAFDRYATDATGSFNVYLDPASGTPATIIGTYTYAAYDAAIAGGATCFDIPATAYAGDAADLAEGLQVCVSDAAAPAPGTGLAAGSPPTMGALPTPDCPMIIGVMLDACNDSGGASEGANEFVVLLNGAMPLNGGDFEVDPPSGGQLNDWEPAANITAQMATAGIVCPCCVGADASTVVPANAPIIVMGGNNFDQAYDFSGICTATSGNVYVFADNVNNPGPHFSNTGMGSIVDLDIDAYGDASCIGDGSSSLTYTVMGGATDGNYASNLSGDVTISNNGCTGPEIVSMMGVECFDCTTFDEEICCTEPDATTAMLMDCDDGDGSIEFTLTGMDATVLGGQTATVTYHSSQADADAGNMALSSPYNSGSATLYARVTVDGGCYTTVEVTLVVKPAPAITAVGADPTTCGGSDGSITISGLDASTTYTIVYAGASGTPTSSSMTLTDLFGEIDITGLSAGNYMNISVTDANGCSSNIVEMISLTDPNPPGVPTASGDSYCANETIGSVTATGMTGATFQWYSDIMLTTPATGVSGTNNETWTPTGATTVYVTQTVAGCTSSETVVTIIVNELPVVEIDDPSVCSDVTSVDLTSLEPTGQTGGDWSAMTPTDADPDDGPFTYTYTDSNGCMGSVTITYTIDPTPNIVFADQEYCMGEDTYDLTDREPLLNTGGTWSNASGTIANPMTADPSTGPFTYSYTNADGCSAEGTLTLISLDCTYDLALSKFLNTTGPYNPGDVLSYTICVYNQGALTSGMVEVTDYSATGITFSGLATPLPTMTSGGASLTVTDNGGGVFTLSDIPAKDDICIDLEYTIDANASGTIDNNAEITADSGDDVDSREGDNSMDPPDPNDDSTNDGNNDSSTQDPSDDDFDPASFTIESCMPLVIEARPSCNGVGSTFDIVVNSISGGINTTGMNFTITDGTTTITYPAQNTISGITYTNQNTPITLTVTDADNTSCTTTYDVLQLKCAAQTACDCETSLTDPFSICAQASGEGNGYCMVYVLTDEDNEYLTFNETGTFPSLLDETTYIVHAVNIAISEKDNFTGSLGGTFDADEVENDYCADASCSQSYTGDCGCDFAAACPSIPLGGVIPIEDVCEGIKPVIDIVVPPIVVDDDYTFTYYVDGDTTMPLTAVVTISGGQGSITLADLAIGAHTIDVVSVSYPNPVNSSLTCSSDISLTGSWNVLPCTPVITIDKNDGDDADDTQFVADGTAEFTVTVCNTGNEQLCGVVITDTPSDPLLDGSDCEPNATEVTVLTMGVGNMDQNFDPGECFTYTCMMSGIENGNDYANAIAVTAMGCTSGITVGVEDADDTVITTCKANCGGAGFAWSGEGAIVNPDDYDPTNPGDNTDDTQGGGGSADPCAIGGDANFCYGNAVTFDAATSAPFATVCATDGSAASVTFTVGMISDMGSDLIYVYQGAANAGGTLLETFGDDEINFTGCTVTASAPGACLYLYVESDGLGSCQELTEVQALLLSCGNGTNECDNGATAGCDAAAGDISICAINPDPFMVDQNGDLAVNNCDEYITLTNNTAFVYDISGWTIWDATASARYTFPAGSTIQPFATITIYNSDITGGISCPSIWNNGGDEARIEDCEGNVIDLKVYQGQGDDVIIDFCGGGGNAQPEDDNNTDQN